MRLLAATYEPSGSRDSPSHRLGSPSWDPAARRPPAAEAGKTVIGIEAQEEDGYGIFGRDFGHINSQFLADAGAPEVDVVEFYNN